MNRLSTYTEWHMYKHSNGLINDENYTNSKTIKSRSGYVETSPIATH